MIGPKLWQGEVGACQLSEFCKELPQGGFIQGESETVPNPKFHIHQLLNYKSQNHQNLKSLKTAPNQ